MAIVINSQSKKSKMDFVLTRTHILGFLKSYIAPFGINIPEVSEYKDEFYQILTTQPDEVIHDCLQEAKNQLTPDRLASSNFQMNASTLEIIAHLENIVRFRILDNKLPSHQVSVVGHKL